MKRYLETRVKLVSALKEGATSSSLATPIVKIEQMEGVFVVDVEGTFFNEPKKKVHASTSTSTSSPVFLLFGYAQATQTALASLRALPYSDPL